MQILILGPHRSGTSLVTRIVNLMGAYFGPEETSIGANEENPKGFWERRDVIAVNDALLQHHGCEWQNLSTWPLHGDEAPARAPDRHIETEIERILASYETQRPWVMKDPRTCHTAPYWRYYLKSPVAIVTYRDPMEVATSLATRNGISLSHGLALWHYASVGALNTARTMPHVFCDYQTFIDHPVKAAKALFSELEAQGITGLMLPSDADIRAFVDAALHRSRPGNATADALMSREEAELAALAAAGRLPDTPLRYCLKAADVMEAYGNASCIKDLERERDRLKLDVATLQTQLEQSNRMTGELKHALREMDLEFSDYRSAVQRLNKENAELHARLGMVQAELQSIKDSRTWRLRNQLVKAKQDARIWKRHKPGF